MCFKARRVSISTTEPRPKLGLEMKGLQRSFGFSGKPRWEECFLRLCFLIIFNFGLYRVLVFWVTSRAFW